MGRLKGAIFLTGKLLRKIGSALDKAGVKNELVVIDDAGHDGPAFSTLEVQSKVIHFLDGVLK